VVNDAEGELCQFINAIIESEHQNAELSLKAQIQKEIPDIDLSDGVPSLSLDDMIVNLSCRKELNARRNCD
jgi:hypothetical protein